jgi:hypothetical protein
MGLIGLVVAASGCDDGTDPSHYPIPDHNARHTIEGTIEWFAQSWAQRRFPEYQEVLHDQFEFLVRDDEVNDFPWLPSSGWGRAIELEIARNMFDDNLVGQVRPVEMIDFQYRVIDQSNIEDAQQHVIAVEVTCDVNLSVLVSPNDGWHTDTRFVFEVVADPGYPGLYQIKKQREQRVL